MHYHRKTAFDICYPRENYRSDYVKFNQGVLHLLMTINQSLQFELLTGQMKLQFH